MFLTLTGASARPLERQKCFLSRERAGKETPSKPAPQPPAHDLHMAPVTVAAGDSITEPCELHGPTLQFRTWFSFSSLTSAYLWSHTLEPWRLHSGFPAQCSGASCELPTTYRPRPGQRGSAMFDKC